MTQEMQYVAKLGLDSQGLVGQIQEATTAMLAFTSASSAGLALVVGAAATLVTTYAGITKNAKDVLDMAEATDRSTDEIQRMQWAMRYAGEDVNAMDSIMQKFTTTIEGAKTGTGDAAAALKQLGVATEGKTDLAILVEVVNALEGRADRAAIASNLFGRSWQTSLEKAQDYVEYAPTVDKSLIMTTSSLEKAADQQERWNRMMTDGAGALQALTLAASDSVIGTASFINFGLNIGQNVGSGSADYEATRLGGPRDPLKQQLVAAKEAFAVEDPYKDLSGNALKLKIMQGEVADAQERVNTAVAEQDTEKYLEAAKNLALVKDQLLAIEGIIAKSKGETTETASDNPYAGNDDVIYDTDSTGKKVLHNTGKQWAVAGYLAPGVTSSMGVNAAASAPTAYQQMLANSLYQKYYDQLTGDNRGPQMYREEIARQLAVNEAVAGYKTQEEAWAASGYKPNSNITIIQYNSGNASPQEIANATAEATDRILAGG